MQPLSMLAWLARLRAADFGIGMPDQFRQSCAGESKPGQSQVHQRNARRLGNPIAVRG